MWQRPKSTSVRRDDPRSSEFAGSGPMSEIGVSVGGVLEGSVSSNNLATKNYGGEAKLTIGFSF